MGKKRYKQEENEKVEQSSQKAGPKALHYIKAQITKKNKRNIIIACVLVFIVGFMVYANTLSGDFIWDDEYLILNNSQIKSFSHLPNVFKTYVGYGSENINNFYRPFQEIANMVDYYLWGRVPFGFHLTNNILHALVGVMVFLLIFYLCGDILLSGVAALFYTVHPVHTEAVAYIAGRADSLYALFFLLSMVVFIRFVNSIVDGKRNHVLYFLSIFFFICSLLSKEIIIAMPLIVFTYLYFILRKTDQQEAYKKLRWSWVPYFLIVVVYAYLRSTVLNWDDIAPQSIFVRIPLVYRLLTFFKTIVVYLKLLVYPVGLHMERAIPITRSIFEPVTLGGLALVSGIVYTACRLYKRNRLVAFAIVWFFANLAPVSNVVPINSFLAEHWIYMASVGAFIIAGVIVKKGYVMIPVKPVMLRAGYLVLIALLIAAYARAAVIKNLDWKNEVSFFTSTLKHHPNNARLYLNLGNTYYENKDIDKAIEQYKKAIEINKGYAVAYGNIGSAYLHTGRDEEAREYIIKALSMKPNYPIAHYNLGMIYLQEKDYAKAEAELRLSVEQLPQLYQAWNMLARVYLKQKKPKEAKMAFERSLAIMPHQADVKKILSKLDRY